MAVEENLAQLSNSLVYSAMLAYTCALGAFVTDLAKRGSAVSQSVEVGEVERERVAVASAGSIAEGRGAAAGVSSPGGAASGGSAAEAPTGVRGLRTKAGGIAVSLTWLAFALHLAAVITRGLSVQRAPWGNMFEFATSGSMVVTGVYLVVLLRRDVRYLGTFVIAPVLLTLGLALTVFYTEAAQLVPALRSFWLVIHVSVAFIASALFTLGFSTTVLQLIQERRATSAAAGHPWRRGRFMDALPSAADLERSSYALHIAAFPLWGFTLIAGAIWAESAWGKYWNWDPKEVWTFIIWVVYAAYLHARATRGWDGRRAAYLAMAGYACLLTNFLVVNFFAVGMHTYAK